MLLRRCVRELGAKSHRSIRNWHLSPKPSSPGRQFSMVRLLLSMRGDIVTSNYCNSVCISANRQRPWCRTYLLCTSCSISSIAMDMTFAKRRSCSASTYCSACCKLPITSATRITRWNREKSCSNLRKKKAWKELSRSADAPFGSLLLGLYQGKKLRFIGHVGSGFDGKTQKEIAGKLKQHEVSTCPFDAV